MKREDLDAALDALYAATPETFVATRASLAKEHGAEIAAVLEKRRKPTRTAYALNQLARRSPDAVADLVDAGRVLARAQRKALRGDPAGVRDAIARQRTVIRERMADVAALVGELGVDSAHLPEIAAALQAALVDPAIGAQLEAGHLERTPEAPTGFPMPGDMRPSKAKAKTGAKADAKTGTKANAETDTKAKAVANAKAKADAKAKAAADVKAKAKADAQAKAKAVADAKAKSAARAAAARRAAEAEAVRLETIATKLAEAADAAVRAAKKAARMAQRARRLATHHERGAPHR